MGHIRARSRSEPSPPVNFPFLEGVKATVYRKLLRGGQESQKSELKGFTKEDMAADLLILRLISGDSNFRLIFLLTVFVEVG